MSKLVIVGNGVAGVTAARAARRRDAQLDITVLAAEATPYYSRPGLHYVLTGLTQPEDLHPLPALYWDTNRIRVLHAEAYQIEARAVVLTDGRRLPFDRCVIATGSIPRDLTGAAEAMVAGLACRLHRKADIEAINAVLKMHRNFHPSPSKQRTVRPFLNPQHFPHVTPAPQPRAIVLGAGLTGLELAELCAQRGYNTDVFFPESDPQQALLDGAERRWLASRMKAHGVSFYRGETARSVILSPTSTPADTDVDGPITRMSSVASRGTSPGTSSFSPQGTPLGSKPNPPDHSVGVEVVFASGRTEQANVLALALGVEPCVAIAQRSGIATARGITVGPDFQTSQPGVYAIGDVAEMDDKISTLWYTARQQAIQMVEGWYGAKLVAGSDPSEAYNSAQFFGIDYHFWGDASLLPGSSEDVHFVSESGARVRWPGRVLKRFWGGERSPSVQKGTDRPEDQLATRMVRLIGSEGKLGAVSALGYRLRGDAVRADLGRPLAMIDVHRISSWGFEPEFTQTTWKRTEAPV